MVWVLSAFAAIVPASEVTFDVKVSGPLAEVEIRQTFVNDSAYAVDGTYRYRMHPRAVVDGMQIRLEDRTIDGRILEKKEARRVYEAAIAAGQTAGLTEAQKWNEFTQEVGNIPPNAQLEVILKLVQPVDRLQRQFSLQLQGTDAGSFGDAVDSVPTADVSVEIDAGMPLADVECVTHQAFEAPTGDGWTVLLEDTGGTPVTIRWRLAEEEAQIGAVYDAQHLMVVLEPPESTMKPRPRAVAVVAERQHAGLAQQLVQALSAQGSAEILIGDPVANVDLLMARPEVPTQQYILVVSDGRWADAEGLLQRVTEDPRHPVYTVAASANAHRFVLDELALISGGRAFSQPLQIPSIVSLLGQPTFSDIQIDWGDWGEVELAGPIPDVHLGDPIQVLGRTQYAHGGVVDVSGMVGTQRQSFRVEPRVVPSGRAIASTWARTRIESLGRRQVRTGVSASAEGLPLALSYSILSPWTSFVAVDPRMRTFERSPDLFEDVSVVAATVPSDDLVLTTTQTSKADFKQRSRDRSRRPLSISGKKGAPAPSKKPKAPRAQVLTPAFKNQISTGRSYQSTTSMAAGVVPPPPPPPPMAPPPSNQPYGPRAVVPGASFDDGLQQNQNGYLGGEAAPVEKMREEAASRDHAEPQRLYRRSSNAEAGSLSALSVSRTSTQTGTASGTLDPPRATGAIGGQVRAKIAPLVVYGGVDTASDWLRGGGGLGVVLPGFSVGASGDRTVLDAPLSAQPDMRRTALDGALRLHQTTYGGSLDLYGQSLSCGRCRGTRRVGGDLEAFVRIVPGLVVGPHVALTNVKGGDADVDVTGFTLGAFARLRHRSRRWLVLGDLVPEVSSVGTARFAPTLAGVFGPRFGPVALVIGGGQRRDTRRPAWGVPRRERAWGGVAFGEDTPVAWVRLGWEQARGPVGQSLEFTDVLSSRTWSRQALFAELELQGEAGPFTLDWDTRVQWVRNSDADLRMPLVAYVPGLLIAHRPLYTQGTVAWKRGPSSLRVGAGLASPLAGQGWWAGWQAHGSVAARHEFVFREDRAIGLGAVAELWNGRPGDPDPVRPDGWISPERAGSWAARGEVSFRY